MSTTDNTKRETIAEAINEGTTKELREVLNQIESQRIRLLAIIQQCRDSNRKDALTEISNILGDVVMEIGLELSIDVARIMAENEEKAG